MLNQTFSKTNLSNLLSKKDFINFKIMYKDKAYLDDMEKISVAVNDGTIFDSPFRLATRNGKIVCHATSLHNTLVLRKLNDNVKRLYKVKQSDRSNTVKQVRCVLEDMVPMWVTKLDIEDFYESVDRGALLKKLYTDSLLSYQSKVILSKLFERPELSVIPGLPRGLSISATLSEIYLRDLDRYISKIDGVYFYSRYVDDILIFSYESSDRIYNIINEYICTNLNVKLNPKKTKFLKFNCRCRELCKCKKTGSCENLTCLCHKGIHNVIAFDYLGYEFKIEKVGDKKKPGSPVVALSTSKTKKYKTRIALAFRDFVKNKDFPLLEIRIKFLTGNCFADPYDRKKKLKTGIYYNYQIINDTTSLQQLDQFLVKVLFSKRGSLGSKLKLHLSATQKQKLNKYKFTSGYKNKIFYAFSGAQLSQIGECWQL